MKLSRLHLSIAVLAVLALLSAGIVYAHQGSSARSFAASAFQRHDGKDRGSSGEGDSGDLSKLPAMNLALEPKPDPSGIAGGNAAAVSYTAGGKTMTPTSVRSRLFYTGVNGLEPMMAVAKNGYIFAGGYSRQNYANGQAYASRPAVMRSTDGGKTWEDVSPQVNGVYTHANTEDPYLYMDQTTQRLFFVDYVGCYIISYSDDYGKTWTNDAPLCGWNLDHQTLFAGPAVTSQTSNGYPNIVYLCSIGGGVATPSSVDSVCSKSLDGGNTWVPTGDPAYAPNPSLFGQEYGVAPWCDGATGHMFVDSHGYLYLPRGVCGQPWLAISYNEGGTWTHVQVANNGMARDDYAMTDHEADVRVDSLGNIYYAWVARDRIPYLTISRDGGRTWSQPIRIAPPNLKEADLPEMALGAPGKIEIGYMGSTNSPGYPFPNDSECGPTNAVGFTQGAVTACDQAAAMDTGPYKNTTFNGYITYSTNALAKTPAFTSATINNPTIPLIRGTCGPFRCKAEFDFIDVEIGPDGSPYEEAIAGCDKTQCYSIGASVVGRLVGAPSLH